MNLKLFTAVFLLQALLCRAQKGHFNLVVGGGPGYCFKEPVAGRHVVRSLVLGVNYMFPAKNSTFIFSPGIHLVSNDYHATLQYDYTARTTQRLLNATLNVLLRAGKHLYFRGGLFFNKEFSTNIRITHANAAPGGYYSFGNSELDRRYHPADLQAGAQLGISIPFHLFKHEQRFDMTWVQLASPLVGSDFTLEKSQVGEDITVLSVHARPALLVFSFEFSLEKRKKANVDEE